MLVSNLQSKKTQDSQKLRQESESNSSAESKEKKCELMAKEEPVDIKTESMDTEYSTNSEVSVSVWTIYVCPQIFRKEHICA